MENWRRRVKWTSCKGAEMRFWGRETNAVLGLEIYGPLSTLSAPSARDVLHLSLMFAILLFIICIVYLNLCICIFVFVFVYLYLCICVWLPTTISAPSAREVLRLLLLFAIPLLTLFAVYWPESSTGAVVNIFGTRGGCNHFWLSMNRSLIY